MLSFLFTRSLSDAPRVAKDKAGKTTTVTRKVTVDTSAPVIKSVTLTTNPVDCGKTFIIAVEITD